MGLAFSSIRIRVLAAAIVSGLSLSRPSAALCFEGGGLGDVQIANLNMVMFLADARALARDLNFKDFPSDFQNVWWPTCPLDTPIFAGNNTAGVRDYVIQLLFCSRQ
jgi:hypothetical protein